MNNRPHFVVMVQARGRLVQIIDFPNRARWIPVADLRTGMKWNGMALHISERAGALDELRRDALKPRHASLLILIALAAVAGALSWRWPSKSR